MLGVEGYGSDDNSDSESAPAPAPVVRKLPATSTKPAKRPKKITIDLPKPTANADEDEDEKPAKRPRLDGLTKGAGISGLVSMLPAPKQQNPIPTRVLGGGKGPGLVFNSSRPVEEESASGPSPSLFMPTSVSRGKPNISTEESTPRAKGVGVDFFSIPEVTKAGSQSSDASKTPLLPSLSSAPKIEEFIAPEPTPQDQYPGYYQLPNGKWAAHDTDYYQSFYKKWQKDYDKYVRDLEKGKIKGFEDLDEETATGVNAMEEMEKAKVSVKELEERKALTKGGDQPQAPKMNIKGAALSGRAKSRHQLSTLLTEAYQNREALEEQIAQGRRNRKEAGNKYGF